MSSARKVYVTRLVPQTGIDILKPECDLSFWESDEAIPQDELLKNVKGIDGLFCMLTDNINKDVIDAAGPNLKVIATMSVGYEHIDLVECKKRGIVVANTPNVSTDSVAELTVSLLLLTSRRLLEGVRAVKNGEWGLWKPMWLLGTELTQRTVGILGLGRIGYGVARRLRPFGVRKIIYHDVVCVSYASDIGADFVSFDELVKQSDFICICCNLTAQTRHKFNKDAFKMMKKSAILINSGRGGVVNHDDLHEALVNGEITAAGIDVTEPEPLPASHPLVSIPNCIVLPHMGSNTWESRNSMSSTAAKNILAVFHKEKPMGEVN
ncbi:hypothetical protein LOTGIDRAFT_125448 [Lottia gigantea]|uniref:Glyoxylate reductase/hydroxypyruvate reductase n=1 Tax=Lottia gigantea TaxID=225164 RepID=V4A6B1_LOTGI|nr:hypothetical protein LOTGIDRAFT_125448 [Lottia gigantea]ESO88816.1 hypothetical protein LOTGIDRAFT_125448 [Lottia gigantea]